MKNIMVIMTDQHKYDAISLFGNIPNLTPNIDSIAADGIAFTNAYAPSPVCGPARACLFTGTYCGENGVVRNWTEFKEGIKVLPETLQENGYLTFLSGKLHFMPHVKNFGFSIKHLNDAPYTVYSDDAKYSKYIEFLKEHYYEDEDVVKMFDDDEIAIDYGDMKRFILGSGFRNEEEHDIPWTTQNVLEFIKEYDGKQPFFINTSYFGPHHPYLSPEPYDTMFENIDLPTNFNTDMSDKPIFNELCIDMLKKLRNCLEENDYKKMLQAYYGQVKMIDDYIGKILDALKSKKLYDETTIIFTSDHGDYLGSYGLFFKGQMYDACCKVPFIIKPAGNTKKRVCNSVISSIDLYSTVLEVAGIEIDSEYSNSLVPFYEDESYRGKDLIYSVIEQDNKIHTMCRKGKYKLMKVIGIEESPLELYELYNLELDNNETNNIWDKMKAEQEVLNIKAKLDIFSEKQRILYSEVLK